MSIDLNKYLCPKCGLRYKMPSRGKCVLCGSDLEADMPNLPQSRYNLDKISRRRKEGK